MKHHGPLRPEARAPAMSEVDSAAPRPVDLLIHNTRVITMDAAGSEWETGAVAVHQGRIAGIGPDDQLALAFAPRRRIDGRGTLCLPGLINAHMHPAFYLVASRFSSRRPAAPGALARGGQIGRFLAQFGRIDRIGVTPEETFAGAMAGLVRVMKTGATCVNDGGLGDLDSVAEAVLAIGMRGIATQGGGGDLRVQSENSPPEPDEGAIAELERTARRLARWKRHPSGRIRAWFNVTTDLNASDEYWRRVKALADEHGVGVSSHTCTVALQDDASIRWFGQRGIARMQRLGVLGPNWMGIHMGFPSEDEVQALAAAGASVVHCPATSMGMGKGILVEGVVPRYRAAGVTVALGSDSPQWGDMVQQMQFAFYVHKDVSRDDTVMPADEVLAMATRDAAKALLWDQDIGSLEVGKSADLILVDIDQLRYASLSHPLLGLMRAGFGADVKLVMVDGRILVEKGELVGLDEARILAQAGEAARSLAARLS